MYTAHVFPVAIACLAALGSASPLPELARRQDNSFAITEPAAGSTIFAGQNFAISWVPGDNSAVTLSLVNSQGNASNVELASGINGFSGSFVATAPTEVENCAEYKVVLNHDNTENISEPFYISRNSEKCAQPTTTTSSADGGVDAIPSATVLYDNLSGATAVASISIISPDGTAMQTGSNAAALVPASSAVTIAGAVLASVLLF